MKESASDQPSPLPLVCPSCHARLPLAAEDGRAISFCLYCGASIGMTIDKTISISGSSNNNTSNTQFGNQISLVQGHIPGKEQVQFSIGPYQILSSIGKGGMGEVFLAYDTTCGRRIALKRIREDLNERQLLHNRFLKEARITSQLMHPAVIPIYAIHASDELLYYTMPYVEGETLKQILRTTRQQEKRGAPLHHLGGSIPALIRIFITVCQAVAYAHAKGVLHRDLKPENVMIGRYGEVMILDWGLAKLIESPDDPEEIRATQSSSETHSLRHLTNIGKVVGTITYMSPERAMGNPATVQTDIYALGVTLYQLLTLHLPFRRETLKEFRQNMHKEEFLEPSEVAPYREVPPALSAVCRKSLEPTPELRYKTVEEFIHDLEIYLEGRPEWIKLAKLDISKKDDWEFQENVLIAEHVEITRFTDFSDWFSLMISRSSFPQNLRLEATVTLGHDSCGLGFLMNVPEPPERMHLIDGYCLWLGSETFRDTKLLSSNVEVMRAADTYLQAGKSYQIRIEKVENNIHFYINDQLQLAFVSHLPLAGTHVGLLSRDVDYTISDFKVSGGSQSLMVNCLAVPDSFLAHKDYHTALIEYRRIAYSFPGRAEGREAIFRAGVTLMELAKQSQDVTEATEFYELALDEFAKLHSTPGAPLEYLGKAIVYQAQGDYEEELKCFELALRRYPQHPLLHVIQEHIAHRMHECSRKHRKATYNFALLVLRHLPDVALQANAQKLFENLQGHWEPLPFFEPCPAGHPCEDTKNRYFAITLAFWLAKPFAEIEVLEEMLEDPIPDTNCVGNALYALLEMGCWKLVEKRIHQMRMELPKDKLEAICDTLDLLDIAVLSHEHSISDGIGRFLTLDKMSLRRAEIRIALHLMEEALALGTPELASELADKLYELQLISEDRLLVNAYHIWAELLHGNLAAAGQLLHTYSVAELTNENTPLYFLYGCFLQTTEGQLLSEVHFSGLLDAPYPRSWSLLGHFLTGKITDNDRWLSKAFMWERRQLYRQLSLYYHCAGQRSQADHYHKLAREEFIYVDG
ncbi:MAG: serine/threonine-protein kinase PknD [Chlamydiales bacterium]|nr:serine/threonine-protein kinase PknD [Chlamydiales bacterium]